LQGCPRFFFRELYLQKKGAATAGKHSEETGLPVGSLVIPEDFGSDCAFLPPKKPNLNLSGMELASMRATQMQESAIDVSLAIEAQKYYRADLASGNLAGSTPNLTSIGVART